jgi:uncharacterized protein Yka (UPF0111/DUF47 family)
MPTQNKQVMHSHAKSPTDVLWERMTIAAHRIIGLEKKSKDVDAKMNLLGNFAKRISDLEAKADELESKMESLQDEIANQEVSK